MQDCLIVLFKIFNKDIIKISKAVSKRYIFIKQYTYSLWALHGDSEQLDGPYSQVPSPSVWEVPCNIVQHCPQQHTVLKYITDFVWIHLARSLLLYIHQDRITSNQSK